jgi:hypothetical protein
LVSAVREPSSARSVRPELHHEIGQLRTEFHHEIGQLRGELHHEMGQLRTELAQMELRIGQMEVRIKERMRAQMIWLTGLVVAALGLFQALGG